MLTDLQNILVYEKLDSMFWIKLISLWGWLAFWQKQWFWSKHSLEKTISKMLSPASNNSAERFFFPDSCNYIPLIKFCFMFRRLFCSKEDETDINQGITTFATFNNSSNKCKLSYTILSASFPLVVLFTVCNRFLLDELTEFNYISSQT